MKTFNIALLTGSALAVLGAHAAEVSIEGRWLVGGAAQKSVETACSLGFYGEDGASSPLWTTNGCRLATDSDGYFVVGASTPAGIELPSTFWVGVSPDGRSEITPRFRVAPAPFALAAETAELVKTDVPLKVSGVAQIDRLETSGDVVVKDWMIPSGGRIETRNIQFPYVRLAALDMVKGSMLGIFNDGGRIPSCDYDNFAENGCSWYVEAYIRSRGFLRHDASDTRSVDASCSFGNDGFLLLAIKADPMSCPSPKLSVKVGAQQFFEDKEFGNGKRFMTVPYRAGEDVVLKLTATGGGEVPFWKQDYYRGNIGVKLRLVRFGRD